MLIWVTLAFLKEKCKESHGLKLCSWFLRAVFETKNKV